MLQATGGQTEAHGGVGVEAAHDAMQDAGSERITAADICVTSDIPLAARCLERGARALSSTGRLWTTDNIGNALAGRGPQLNEAIAALRRLVVNGQPLLNVVDKHKG